MNAHSDAIDWEGSPNHPGVMKDEIEQEIKRREELLVEWIERIAGLVSDMQSWLIETDWATKQIPHRLDDHEIGRYKVTALLIQRNACRIFVEPVSRATPGTQGVVDMCLMPGYDDIASIYHYDEQWKIHYKFEAESVIASVNIVEAVALTSETLLCVLDKMYAHATE